MVCILPRVTQSKNSTFENRVDIETARKDVSQWQKQLQGLFWAHTSNSLTCTCGDRCWIMASVFSTPVLWNICMFKNKLEVEVAAQRSRTAAKAITRCLVEHKSNVFACIYCVTCWKMTCIFSRPVLWKIWMLERRLEGEVAAQTSRTAAKAITRTFDHKSKVFASNYWGRCWKMACIFSRTVLWKISMFEKKIKFEITAQRSRTVSKKEEGVLPCVGRSGHPK